MAAHMLILLHYGKIWMSMQKQTMAQEAQKHDSSTLTSPIFSQLPGPKMGLKSS